ncbi:hypothetical protein MXB_3746 [Myxobolus squamalis]|nr:hypothetical protein MXB_3746 [Myxobolus squamalis]
MVHLNAKNSSTMFLNLKIIRITLIVVTRGIALGSRAILVFQIIICPSYDPLIMYRSSNRMHLTSCWCPTSVLMHTPFSTSQILIINYKNYLISASLDPLIRIG